MYKYGHLSIHIYARIQKAMSLRINPSNQQQQQQLYHHIDNKHPIVLILYIEVHVLRHNPE